MIKIAIGNLVDDDGDDVEDNDDDSKFKIKNTSPVKLG